MRYVTKEELRDRLPLDLVLGRYGVALDDYGRGLCPFHDDHDPSLGIWLGDDGVERWKCWPCDLGGDVFDLIKRVEGLTFPEAVRRAEAILDEGLPPGYERKRARKSPPPDMADWGQALRAAQLHMDPRLRDQWGWGMDDFGNLLMPHYGEDRKLTGVKVRSREGRRWSWPGSVYPNLYGAWRPRSVRDTLLCEGETDTVWADSAMRDGPHPLGLPSGALYFREEWLPLLRGGTVYLALDGDAEGWRATREIWAPALQGAGVACATCPVPGGEDLRSSQPDMQLLIAGAKPIE